MTMLGFVRGWRAAARMLTVAFIVVMVSTTAVIGEEQAAPSARGGEVTFAKDVAPILQRNCQNCHRPGQIGPMSLLTYRDARPWARSIKQRVQTREMPPWFIDRDLGVQKFKNDVSLTEEEIATIVQWVDNGAPRGNPADMPPPREFDDMDRWHIGEPDLIVSDAGRAHGASRRLRLVGVLYGRVTARGGPLHQGCGNEAVRGCPRRGSPCGHEPPVERWF